MCWAGLSVLGWVKYVRWRLSVLGWVKCVGRG